MDHSYLALSTQIVELDDDALTEDHVSHTIVLPHRDAPEQPLHRSKQRTRCSICNLELLKKTLPRHMRAVHAIGQSLLYCCDIQFSRRDTLERHEQEQHRGIDKTVLCDICNSRISHRTLGEHRQSQKCKDARRAQQQHVPMEGFVVVRLQTGLPQLLDPLLIAAKPHRSGLLTWSTAYAPDRHSLTISIGTIAGRQSAVHLIIGRAVASASPHTTRDYDRHTPGLRMIEGQLSSSQPYGEILRLRTISLHRTRQMLAQVIHDDAVTSTCQTLLDHGIIAVSLLSTVDEFIFGGSSPEQMTYAQGFTALWRSYKNTDKTFVPLFENLKTCCPIHDQTLR